MPRVRDLMTVDVPLTTLNTPVSDAARLMRAADRDSLIVFDLGRAIGIVTERDIIRKITAEGLDAMHVHVGKIVSSPLITIHPDRPAREAAALMLEKKIRHLPVVKDNRLLGIITLADFAKHMRKKSVKDEFIESMGKDADQPLALMQQG
ncbi:MAG: CBS domain-containing protein [Thaumarchaeota archaeon]|nr:CBS domain-containing protein [Nitrososphaerota archaeon]